MNKVETIRIVISLLAIWFMYFVVYKKMVEEYFRDKLFEVRNELFLSIASKNPSLFTTAAYRQTERMLNNAIYLLGFMDFSTVLFILMQDMDLKTRSAGNTRASRRMLKQIHDKHVRRSLEEAEQESMQLLVRSMFWRSPVAGIVAFVLILLYMVVKGRHMGKAVSMKSASREYPVQTVCWNYAYEMNA